MSSTILSEFRDRIAATASAEMQRVADEAAAIGYRAGQEKMRARCVRACRGAAGNEAAAHDRAKAAGRELVAECRQAGLELAERLTDTLAALPVEEPQP